MDTLQPLEPSEAEIIERAQSLHVQVEAKSSFAMTSPTASQRGGGLPQVEAKKYYLPGGEQQAIADLTAEFQALLDWRPAEAGQ